MGEVRLSLDDARALVAAAFRASNVSAENAQATAAALVAAEADGQKGHGLSRVSSYAAQARAGKVAGHATPALTELSPVAVAVDAGHGFAYPALTLAVEALVPRAKANGVAVASVRRSHHFGQAGAHVEALANHGLIGFIHGNSPKAIAFWGARAPAMGTNPVAFAAPDPNGPPLVIDLALSTVARGKIMAAEKAGEPIPEGWGFDAEGRPTTNASEAMKGSMAPIGGAKGAAMALMMELLAAGLTGGRFGFEASSLFDDKGPPPDLGQTLIALNPELLSGGAFAERMATMMGAIDAADGARPPGQSRLEHRARAARDGLVITEALHREILGLAGAQA